MESENKDIDFNKLDGCNRPYCRFVVRSASLFELSQFVYILRHASLHVLLSVEKVNWPFRR